MLDAQLREALERRRGRGTLRQLTVFPTRPSSASLSTGEASSEAGPSRLVDFSSNDYLSLSSCPKVRQDFLASFSASPDARLGSTGSRLLDGNSHFHERVEQNLTEHFQGPSGLLFNSGYEANVSVFSTLPQPQDVVLFDSLVHASVHDGIRRCRTAPGMRRSFQHNSAHDLAKVLAELRDDGHLGPSSNVWIAVESVYSMDGDLCPLVDLLTVMSHYVEDQRICVVVDEAHSTGLYGSKGRGLVQSLGLQGDPRITIRLMTFGKAMGASGAVILCSDVAKQYLINYARPLIFSTALGYPALFALQAVLDALKDGRGEQRAKNTFANSKRLVTGLAEIESTIHPLVSLPEHLQLQTGHSKCLAPIVPLLTSHARLLAAFLRQNGLLARPICYPTVPKGQDRVRVCLHADNTTEDVDRLVECIARYADSQRQTHTSKSPPSHLIGCSTEETVNQSKL